MMIALLGRPLSDDEQRMLTLIWLHSDAAELGIPLAESEAAWDDLVASARVEYAWNQAFAELLIDGSPALTVTREWLAAELLDYLTDRYHDVPAVPMGYGPHIR